MSTAKEEVHQLLGRLPDDCSLEDIQYQLYVIAKVRNGLVMAEFGDDQDKAVAAIFVEAGWVVREIVRDLAGKPRIIVAGR